MNILGICRSLRLAAAGAAILVVTACTISSEAPLFPTGGGDQALESSFTFWPYKEEEGSYLRQEDGQQDFTFNDGGYASADGNMTAYFLDAGPDYYLLQLVAGDGTMYGTARIDGRGIMELRMVFSGEPMNDLADAGIAPPAGVTFADGGIMLTDRAAAETVVKLIGDGTLKTTPLLVYAGPGLPPDTIVPDGDWYRAE